MYRPLLQPQGLIQIAAAAWITSEICATLLPEVSKQNVPVCDNLCADILNGKRWDVTHHPPARAAT